MSHSVKEKVLREGFEKDWENFPEVILNRELLKMVRIAPGTLNRWQWEGKLPARLPALGRLVRYRKKDVIDWWVKRNLPKCKRGRPTNTDIVAQLEARN